jgi:hypothetical protein
MDLYSYIGAGQVYLENLDQSKGLLPIGEVSALELAIETDKKVLTSNTQSGGGVADSVTRISAVNSSMELSSLSPENVAMALYGSVSKVAVKVVVDEAQDAYPGALVSFVNPPNLAIEPVVKNKAGTTTYAKGVDYELSPAGIRIKVGGTISAKTEIKVGYTSLGHDVIEMLTNSGASYRLVFEGLNEARTDKPVLVELYRNKFDPTSSLGLISDDFGSLSLTGSVLKDTSKAGVGVSKYMSIKMV